MLKTHTVIRNMEDQRAIIGGEAEFLRRIQKVTNIFRKLANLLMKGLNMKKKRTKFIIMAAVIVAVLVVILIYLQVLKQGFPLQLEEYQRISAAIYNKSWPIDNRVIDTKENELSIEKEFSISIEDGTDYEHYSLVISKNYEIKKMTMYPLQRPVSYWREDMDYKHAVMCNAELGKYYGNTYFVYRVKQKHIISWDQLSELDPVNS